MHSRIRETREHGFTLIETMVAVVILSVGVLGLAAVFSQGLLTMSTSQSDLIAKQKAAEAIESVFTSRDTHLLTWSQIRNVTGGSGTDGGVFLDGPRRLLDPGPDGLVNTLDDDALKPDSIILPGPDNILGSGDDVKIPLSNFTREIQIRDVSANLRSVQVIMRYTVGRLSLTYTLTTYISSFA